MFRSYISERLNIVLIIVSMLVSSTVAHGQETRDVHYTTLLPIMSNLKAEDKKSLEAAIVKKLQKHVNFQFKTHEGFFKVLKKQGDGLKEALYNKEVLKTVSEKLLVGSMIRLEVKEFLLGYEVTLDVLNKEAKSVYHRQMRLNKRSLNFLKNVINFWIQGYFEETPFDASIVEVQDTTLLVDFPGKKDELFPNKQFVVIRRHDDFTEPYMERTKLYEEIAYGVITEVGGEYFIGKLLYTEERFEVNTDDFIQFKIFDEEIAAKNPDYKYRKHDLGNYREHGKVGFFGTLTKVTGDDNTASLSGAMINLDLFLPSNTLLMLEFSRKVGNIEGEQNDDSAALGSSLNDNSYRALLGYTLEPMTYKYISYFDLYGGWAVDQYYLSGLGAIGVGDVSFEGAVLGFRMEHPIYPNLSALSAFDYGFQPRFKEVETSLGEADSTSSLLFQVGLRYRFPRSGFSIEGLYRRKEAKANIRDSDMILNIKADQLMIGISNFF